MIEAMKFERKSRVRGCGSGNECLRPGSEGVSAAMLWDEAAKFAVRPKARERFDNDNGGNTENEAELSGDDMARTNWKLEE